MRAAGSVFHEGDTPELFILPRAALYKHNRALTRARALQRNGVRTKYSRTSAEAMAAAAAPAKREVAESSLDFLHYSIVDTFSRCTVLQGLGAAAAVAAAAYLCDW